MASRSVHLALAESLETSAFLNALFRFIHRRGASTKDICSDNGSNFVGADRELKESISRWNNEHIHNTLCRSGLRWHFNPPAASHQGGVWERIIRSVRKIMRSLNGEKTLTEYALQSLIVRVSTVAQWRREQAAVLWARVRYPGLARFFQTFGSFLTMTNVSTKTGGVQGCGRMDREADSKPGGQRIASHLRRGARVLRTSGSDIGK